MTVFGFFFTHCSGMRSSLHSFANDKNIFLCKKESHFIMCESQVQTLIYELQLPITTHKSIDKINLNINNITKESISMKCVTRMMCLPLRSFRNKDEWQILILFIGNFLVRVYSHISGEWEKSTCVHITTMRTTILIYFQFHCPYTCLICNGRYAVHVVITFVGFALIHLGVWI